MRYIINAISIKRNKTKQISKKKIKSNWDSFSETQLKINSKSFNQLHQLILYLHLLLLHLNHPFISFCLFKDHYFYYIIIHLLLLFNTIFFIKDWAITLISCPHFIFWFSFSHSILHRSSFDYSFNHWLHPYLTAITILIQLYKHTHTQTHKLSLSLSLFVSFSSIYLLCVIVILCIYISHSFIIVKFPFLVVHSLITDNNNNLNKSKHTWYQITFNISIRPHIHTTSLFTLIYIYTYIYCISIDNNNN